MNEHQPRVVVVLCSWQGERHLGEQLDSLAAQTWPHDVIVHDDASRDGTPAVAEAHAATTEVVAHADNVGYVRNFERGIAHALHAGYDYIALADQDDIWHSQRIERGMQLLLEHESRQGRHRPFLTHSDLTLIDDRGEALAPSYLAHRGYAIDEQPHLPRVLGQSGVMGNTVLMNRALAERALPFPQELHVHDWWLGLVAELHGQRLFIDSASVAYRLHEQNASNPAGTVQPGAFTIARRLTWRRLQARDFRLPFKEDSRATVLAQLLEDAGHQAITDSGDRQLIERFLAYLRLERSAPALFVSLLRDGFLRRGIRHRCRVAAALLLSDRYDGARRRPVP